MEVILGIIAVVVILGLIGIIMETISNWFGNINWINFFSIAIFGGIALAVIFSFTAEGVLVIVGAYFVLMILALIFGKFKKDVI